MCCAGQGSSLGCKARGRYSQAKQLLVSAELGWEIGNFHFCVSAWFPIRDSGHSGDRGPYSREER